MLNVEADRRDREPENDRQRDDQPPAGDREEKQEVRAKEPGENRCGLEVHLRTITSRAAGALKVSINAFAKLADEAVAAVELQRRCVVLCFGRNRCCM